MSFSTHLSSLPTEMFIMHIIPAIEGDKSTPFSNSNAVIRENYQNLLNFGLSGKNFYELVKEKLAELKISYDKNLEAKNTLLQTQYYSLLKRDHLHLAVAGGKPDEIAILLNAEPNVNQLNTHKQTPLEIATRLNNGAVVEILLTHPHVKKKR